MSNWERKALNFINHTSQWEKDKPITAFLPFSISLVKDLTGADISLQVELEDDETARVKNASPAHLDDIIMNAELIRKITYANQSKSLCWKQIPPKENPFMEVLQALSSAVIIPMNTLLNNSLLVLGWSKPQSFENDFLECMETIRLRLKEIMIQTQQWADFQRNSGRLVAILNTIPHALVFINNDGYSGWVNEKGASLLNLSGPGEQLPEILSMAMARLREQALNMNEIAQEAAKLFAAPGNSISGWHWQFGDGILNVSCLPVVTNLVSGRLWTFE